jgi:hypothetical protein
VVAPHVVERRAREGDDVLQVLERQVAARDHSLDAVGVRGEARSIEHRLYGVADCKYLHAWIIPFLIPASPAD